MFILGESSDYDMIKLPFGSTWVHHLGSSPVFGGVRVLHLVRILCSVVCLCFVCPRSVPSMPNMLPVSLDCSFLISHSVFSEVYCLLGENSYCNTIEWIWFEHL
jgi:hypothetical protein